MSGHRKMKSNASGSGHSSCGNPDLGPLESNVGHLKRGKSCDTSFMVQSLFIGAWDAFWERITLSQPSFYDHHHYPWGFLSHTSGSPARVQEAPTSGLPQEEGPLPEVLDSISQWPDLVSTEESVMYYIHQFILVLWVHYCLLLLFVCLLL